MDLSRVVEVSAGMSAGRASFGSGYLVAPGLVLTARHVVCGDDGEVLGEPQVRFTETGTPVPCRVAWPGRPDLDAALLECTGPVPQFELVRWGQLVASEAGIGCEAAGFPRAMEQDDGLRDVEHMRGQINAGTGLLGGRIYADVASARPQPGGWAGMSGAALWCGPLLVGVVAWDMTAFAAGRLAAEPVTLLFTDPDFQALIGEGVAVEAVELAGRRPRVAAPGPAYLLRADQATARFRSRAGELAQLAAWCEAPEPRLWLLTGPGGQGKTRLARELAARLEATGKWVTAMIQEGAQLPADIRRPLLAVVDYAETRPEQTGQLILSALSGPGHTPVRLLLIARSAGDWWTRLRTSNAELEMALAGAIVEELAALEDTPAGRTQAFTEAVHDYRHALAANNWPSAVSDSIAAPDDLAQDQFGSALRLQMTALATLLGGGTDGGGPEDVILTHEARYWRRTADKHGLQHLHEQTLQCAVAAAALCGAADQNEAMALLARVPGLQDQSEDVRIRAARWLRDLYPPPADLPDSPERHAGPRPYWGPLQPDLLAEHLVGQIARLHPDFIVHLLDAASDAQNYRAFSVIDRAASHQPHLVDVWPPLERIIHVHGDNPDGDAAVRHELLRPESTVFALGAPATGSASDTAHLLHCTVPVGDETIPMLPVFTRLKHLVSAVELNPAWQRLQVLRMETHVVLSDLEKGEWLGINPWSGREFKLPPASPPGETGRAEEGAAAAPREALSLDPGNAAAPTGLRNALSDLGRRFEATFASTGDIEESTWLRRFEEAVAWCHERLRVAPDDAFAHEGLGYALHALGRHEDAAAAYREALRVDPDNPAAYAAHAGLGYALHALGRYEDAAAAWREALRVAPDDVLAHQGLGDALTWLGRYEDAAAAYREALRVAPDLATAHQGLGNALAQLGRFEEAQVAYHEALRIDPDNASTNNDLGWLQLHVQGDIGAAEQLLSEAVRLDPTFTTAGSIHLAAALVAKGDQRAAREVVARAMAHQQPPRPKIMLWQWLLARADGSPDTTTLPRVLAALDQASPPTGRTRFADMEVRAVALLGLGDDRAAETLRSAASMRTPTNIFFRPMYELLATPEPPQRLDQLLDVWREIIAIDPAAAGAWGSPEKASG